MSHHGYTTIISPQDLNAMLEAGKVVAVDCRSNLKDPSEGRRQYLESHIRGAVFADLDRDLAGPVTPDSGRHPLPAVNDFLAVLRRLGISNHTQVVAYDDRSGGLAARLWWMLRWLGHDRVAVLDGGFEAWSEAGLPVESGDAHPASGDFEGSPRPGLTVTTEELAATVTEGGFLQLLDARDERRFRGEIEPIDTVAGHVPGAINRPFSAHLAETGRWLDRDAIVAAWRDLEGFDPQRPWSVMCGSGVTACHLALAASIAGLPEPRLYAGSWSEWIRDPERPVAGA